MPDNTQHEANDDAASPEEILKLEEDVLRLTCDFIKIQVEYFGDPDSKSKDELLDHLNYIRDIVKAG